MITIPVRTRQEYAVQVGAGLLCRLGDTCHQAVSGNRVVLVSDSNVWPLYGQTAQTSLEQAGFYVNHFVFPAGEQQKNGQTYLQLLNFLAENHLSRTDCLVALGGGVVGDLTGFAAATYLRGIAYLQVPTTLLAMVDASVGGKTAIDLPGGKNLAGAFYQPRAVLCDTDTLSTLPRHIFTDGCAEVVKYAMAFDADLFGQLEQGVPVDETVIARCIRWKARVVAQDEQDHGPRRLLNFGHTVGHALEQVSGYTLSHGQAVAIGMAWISRSAASAHHCAPELCARLEALLAAYGLPISTELPLASILDAICADKKRSAEQISLVLPATIGCAFIETYPISQLESFIKAGM